VGQLVEKWLEPLRWCRACRRRSACNRSSDTTVSMADAASRTENPRGMLAPDRAARSPSSRPTAIAWGRSGHHTGRFDCGSTRDPHPGLYRCAPGRCAGAPVPAPTVSAAHRASAAPAGTGRSPPSPHPAHARSAQAHEPRPPRATGPPRLRSAAPLMVHGPLPFTPPAGAARAVANTPCLPAGLARSSVSDTATAVRALRSSPRGLRVC